MAAPPPAGPAPHQASEVTWRYADTPLGPIAVVVRVPAGTGPLPVLVALHGWAEALKGPDLGARGWIDDYGLIRAESRLRAPPLVSDDLSGFVDEARLVAINESLAARPYRGLIIVCPYTPREMLSGFDAARPLAAFLADELLPRVRRETPADPSAAATGIDGVSLGGRSALLVGFERPEAFGLVGSLQAAFYDREVPALMRLAARAHERVPALRLRLLTSTQDGYRAVNHALHDKLVALGLDAQFTEVVGPHTYAFNRGPGAIEMLLLHDRALRGEPPVK